MAKILAFVGAEGCTLKTTSAAAVAHAIAKTGVRLVMVDGDPQADLTSRSGLSRVADPLGAPCSAREVPRGPAAGTDGRGGERPSIRLDDNAESYGVLRDGRSGEGRIQQVRLDRIEASPFRCAGSSRNGRSRSWRGASASTG